MGDQEGSPGGARDAEKGPALRIAEGRMWYEEKTAHAKT